MAKTQRICSVDGCNKPAHLRNMCSPHYWRWRRHGDPLAGRITLTQRGAARAYLEETVLPFDSEECLYWPFAKAKGYGVIKINGRQTYVHRLACEAIHGAAASPDMEVAHDCGNGNLGCVNPRHLRWATRSSNHLDKARHGTMLVGETHPRAKLTETDVVKIRGQQGTASQAKIAMQYGISQSAVGLILRRKKWRHIP